jgi:hypothetical protein
MTTDFHVYPDSEKLSIVMDAADPQREEILNAVADILNRHGRSRECDECRHAAVPG